jgi:hypothetical protein
MDLSDAPLTPLAFGEQLYRAFGFRQAENFMAAIYHGCARLPLPHDPSLPFGRETSFFDEVWTDALARSTTFP